jgi:hypothetical protein
MDRLLVQCPGHLSTQGPELGQEGRVLPAAMGGAAADASGSGRGLYRDSAGQRPGQLVIGVLATRVGHGPDPPFGTRWRTVAQSRCTSAALGTPPAGWYAGGLRRPGGARLFRPMNSS